MKKRCVCLALTFAFLLALCPHGLALTALDTYATGSFSRSYDVYTGPGDYYYRANNGKAMYGGGTARIYGVTGDWIMIGYGLGNGDYRIGYITKDALSTLGSLKGAVNYDLTFGSEVAYADDYCRMTDDPIVSQNMFYTIPEGTAVTVLATMGSAWAYVEAVTPNGYMRGFVWSIHLTGGSFRQPTPLPTASPTPQPYYITPNPVITVQPVNTPSQSYANTYYTDTTKGDNLPAYIELKLTGSYPVYSGPGTHYYRANNGKATFGGGYIRLYGVENGWAMIGYGLSNGNYRFGYISADALPNSALHIPYLNLRYTTAQVKTDAKLTDDIARTRTTLVEVPAGTYVLLLGYTNEIGIRWAYIELLINNSIMRGFIPASALTQ